jgi:hypothetical protein
MDGGNKFFAKLFRLKKKTFLRSVEKDSSNTRGRLRYNKKSQFASFMNEPER